MNNENILLTVIIPAYNVELYIAKCIESVIRQTFKNIEILIIDDGSTDCTGEICDKFSKMDSRIKVYHKKNAGLADVRQQGVEQAKGNLITFVDGDDWIEKDMYERMLSDYNNEDMITSGLIYEWKEKKELLFDSFEEGVFDKDSIENIILPQVMYNEVARQQGITASVCNKIFKASLLKKIIKLVDKNLTFGEDGAIVYCFVTYSSKIRIINKAWYHYIQHANSLIRTNDFSSFEKLYRLKVSLSNNLKKSEFDYQMEVQIEHYVRGFLHVTIMDIFGFYINTIFYLFPYDVVPQNSRIILYGAGRVGYSYWKNLQYSNYVKLVAWIDVKYMTLRNKGLPVESLETAIENNFDYIVIAIEDRKIAQEVQNILLKYGIKREKIIWKIINIMI